MNYIDIVIGLVLAFALFKGFKNGLIIELASLAALVLGLLGAIKFHSVTEEFLSQHFDSQYMGLIAFVGTFILIVIGIHLMAKVLDKLVSAILLGPINTILGAAFSLLKFAFIISVLIAVLNAFDPNSNVISKEQKEKSILYKPLASVATFVFPYLEFDHLKEKIKGANKELHV